MPAFLQLIDGVKSDSDQELPAGASVAIHQGMKAGLIGRNETGKRRLLWVLPGSAELGSGEVVQGPHLRIGYLRQHAPFEPKESTRDCLMRDSGQADWKCGEVVDQFEPKGPVRGSLPGYSSAMQDRDDVYEFRGVVKIWLGPFRKPSWHNLQMGLSKCEALRIRLQPIAFTTPASISRWGMPEGRMSGGSQKSGDQRGPSGAERSRPFYHASGTAAR